ncbi:TPA: hypothetical protein H1016_03775 [archaeon]|uniref:Uncharacterized protein n=1 Tax=Candidatus Naiadarchaeum limnaeum TaxID=2756139 RepID=A0A832V1U8_9ARCH|nr:hypothetical protein [Candidatus Naiadarchaeum limnaeum]
MGLPLWLIIAIVLIVLFVVILKMADANGVYVLAFIRDKFFYIFLILILIFLAISLTQIHSTYNIDFTSKEGIGKAMRIYWSWLGNVFSNSGRVIGYAVKQDWFSANVTNASIK